MLLAGGGLCCREEALDHGMRLGQSAPRARAAKDQAAASRARSFELHWLAPGEKTRLQAAEQQERANAEKILTLEEEKFALQGSLALRSSALLALDAKNEETADLARSLQEERAVLVRRAVSAAFGNMRSALQAALSEENASVLDVHAAPPPKRRRQGLASQPAAAPEAPAGSRRSRSREEEKGGTSEGEEDSDGEAQPGSESPAVRESSASVS